MKTRLFTLLALWSSLVIFSTSSFACGPVEKHWYDFGRGLEYDPKAKTDDNQLDIFEASFAQLANQQPKNTNATEKLNLAFQQALQGREIELNIKRGKFAYQVSENNDGYLVNISNYQSNRYGWGVCNANSLNNVELLLAQISANPDISNEELISWLTTRMKIFDYCGNDNKLASVKINRQDLAKPHFRYLNAIKYYYLELHNDAERELVALTEQQDAWFSQLGHYMLARNYLSGAKLNWSGSWQDKRKRVDHPVLNKALAAFHQYVELYPNALFKSSAQGMIRHIAWIKDDFAELKQLYHQDIVELAKAMANKEQFETNELQALKALFIEYGQHISQDLRESLFGEIFTALNAELADNANQKPFINALRQARTLHRALDFYQQQEFAQAIATLQNAAQLETEAKQYRDIILARAYEGQQNFAQANQIWLSLRQHLPKQTIEPLLADNLVASAGMVGLLNNNLDLDDDLLRIHLARQCSLDDITPLVQQAKNKQQLVVYELAMRYLAQDNIKPLSALLQSYTSNELGDLAHIRTAAKMIADGNQLGKAYLNIGYFMQTKIRHYASRYALNKHAKLKYPSSDCAQSVLHKDMMGPYAYYQKALTFFDNSHNESEAKTLHFLVNCHQNKNACIWPYRYGQKNNSKDWFDKLHQKYPSSKWAEKTKHYFN